MGIIEEIKMEIKKDNTTDNTPAKIIDFDIKYKSK